MKHPRSYLFVPSDRADRYPKALQSGADAVIIDLEDAVAPALKDGARACLREWIASQPGTWFPQVWVRVNAMGTEWHAADIAALAGARIAGIVLPKAESQRQLEQLTSALPAGLQVLPLIETGAGVAAAREIARGPRVQRLLFGSVDLRLDLDIQPDASESELAPYRAEVVLASRLAGLCAPVDGVQVEIDDSAMLERMAMMARRMGFGGKLCIHPRQIATVNRAFSPQDDEIAWARRVVESVQASKGAAVAVDGKMVDAPIIALAERLLARAA